METHSLVATTVANAARVRDRIAGAARRSGRNPESVCLVAVAKKFPETHVRAAVAAGLEHIGENRVQEALDKMIDRTLKARSDAKKDKGNILWSGLRNYAKYGSDNPFTSVLANYELLELQAEELTEIIKGITRLPHRILYYGPKSTEDLTAFLSEYHNVPSEFDQIPELKKFEELTIDKPLVYWADYDMVQTEIVFQSKSTNYDASLVPISRLFNAVS